MTEGVEGMMGKVVEDIWICDNFPAYIAEVVRQILIPVHAVPETVDVAEQFFAYQEITEIRQSPGNNAIDHQSFVRR